MELTGLVILIPNYYNDTGLTSIVQVACLLVSQGNILNRHLSPVHVGVRESSHEWVGADHLLDADARAELAVSARELVDLDLHHVGVVVELDEALKRCPLKISSHLERTSFWTLAMASPTLIFMSTAALKASSAWSRRSSGRSDSTSCSSPLMVPWTAFS